MAAPNTAARIAAEITRVKGAIAEKEKQFKTAKAAFDESADSNIEKRIKLHSAMTPIIEEQRELSLELLRLQNEAMSTTPKQGGGRRRKGKKSHKQSRSARRSTRRQH